MGIRSRDPLAMEYFPVLPAQITNNLQHGQLGFSSFGIAWIFALLFAI
jgi:hypothetical protein